MKGRARVFGDDVTTDEIHPGRYYSTDPDILKRGLMAGLNENFYTTVKPGDILVAGRYFGMGSGRESAVKAIKHIGIRYIIAHSFSRYFYRNCINNGIYPLEVNSAAYEIKEGDLLKIDLEEGSVRNISSGKVMDFHPLPDIKHL